jgi:tetratricopeptide (TPR) repeat protein
MPKKASELLIAHEDLSLNEQIPRLTRLVAIDVDLGNLTTAYDLAGEGLKISRDARSNLSEMGFAGARLAISEIYDKVEFSDKLDDTVELIRALIAGGELWRYPTREIALTGKMAARNGYPDQASQLLEMIIQNDSHEGYPMSADYQDLLAGELALALGDIESAMAYFKKVSDGSNLFQVHESLARAYAAQSNNDLEKQELEWLVNHKGQALAEISLSVFGREMNLIDIATASQRLKNIE